MQIVLPGALPDPAEARELTEHVQKAAPTLVRWLRYGQARIVTCDTANNACTPYEQWLLARNGFTASPGQNLSCGLGPLLAQQSAGTPPGGQDGGPTDGNTGHAANAPVWQAELVHIAPSRDGAALLPARDIAIEPDQSVALFQAAQPLFTDSGFNIAHTSTAHWQVVPQDREALPASVSPTLVGLTSVNDWWPQDTATRSWRRLVNELQMCWFEHPVNQARARQGLPDINSLWVFGGASPAQFHSSAKQRRQARPQIHFELVAAHTRHDWSGWLAALADLEERLFKPLDNDIPALVLAGNDRYVELRPRALRQFTRWLPGAGNTWRNWWSPHN
jgi:hypothetical protein